jgi:hypothetical protein
MISPFHSFSGFNFQRYLLFQYSKNQECRERGEVNKYLNFFLFFFYKDCIWVCCLIFGSGLENCDYFVSRVHNFGLGTKPSLRDTVSPARGAFLSLMKNRLIICRILIQSLSFLFNSYFFQLVLFMCNFERINSKGRSI